MGGERTTKHGGTKAPRRKARHSMSEAGKVVAGGAVSMALLAAGVGASPTFASAFAYESEDVPGSVDAHGIDDIDEAGDTEGKGDACDSGKTEVKDDADKTEAKDEAGDADRIEGKDEGDDTSLKTDDATDDEDEGSKDDGEDPEVEDAFEIATIQGLRGDGSHAPVVSGGAYRDHLVAELSEPVQVDWEHTMLMLVSADDEDSVPVEILAAHEDDPVEVPAAREEEPEEDKTNGDLEDAGDSSPDAEADAGDSSKDEPEDDPEEESEDEHALDSTTSDSSDDVDKRPEALDGCVEFEVPEGRYAKLWVVVRAADGTQQESPVYENVVFDETEPVAHFELAGKEPANDALIPEGGACTVVLEESFPAQDEGGQPKVLVTVTNEATKSELTVGEWSYVEGEGSWVAQVGPDDLGDGNYRVAIRCVDAAGNAMRDYARSFSIDTLAPLASAEVPLWDMTGQRDGQAYFDHDVSLVALVKDAHLDEAGTKVLGVPLSELVAAPDDYACAGGTFTCLEVERVDNEDKTSSYRLRLTLHDGWFDVGELVSAVDALGWQSSCVLTRDERDIQMLVIDSEAPDVRAFVSVAPANGVTTHDDGGQTVFFDDATELRFAFGDASGIDSVALDETGASETHALLVSPDNSSATLKLAEGPFADAARIVVTDRAGNTTWWSLAASGEQQTHAGRVMCENEPIRDLGEELVADGHPRCLIEDVRAPEVALAGVEEGSFVAQGVTLSVEVSDQYLGYVATFAPDRSLMSVACDGETVQTIAAGYAGASTEDTEHTYELSLPARKSHEDDGAYVVELELVDLAGNASRNLRRSFVIDTTAPMLAVTYDDTEARGEKDGTAYYSSERTARIELSERFLLPEDLNQADPWIHVVPQASLGRVAADVSVSAWELDSATGTLWCDVTFPVDGTFDLEVYGTDKAGNLLVGSEGTEVDESGRYATGPFVIDASAPRVSISYSSTDADPRSHEGVAFYRHPVTVTVEVVDRNLDVTASTVTDSEGRPTVVAWKASEPDAQGGVTYTASLLYLEEGTGAGAGRKQATVAATDLAKNAVTQAGDVFVVDQTAPEIDRAWVSKDPSATAADREGDDPYWFYNERDGVAAVLSLSFGDEFLLDSAWVVDPDGVYDVRQPAVHGARAATIELRLRDFVEEGNDKNTDLERNVLLYVRDMAKNERVWSLDRTGRIVSDRVTSDGNASLGDAGIFPVSLVRDTTAPHVALAGVEAGVYYKEPPVARVTVNEHNFGFLTRFDPGRVVLLVSKVAGNESQARSSWTLDAQSLKGTTPLFGADQAFEEDGHYTLLAQFEDMAKNESNVASVGTFTVDRTAPVLQVSWDNDDVRNAGYYNAGRTATVRVTEHNFDPSLISINTTGVAGGWSSSGDTHVCQVVFASDAPASAPHTLSITGRDLAGNEAVAFEEPPFVVDTQAPVVSIRRRVSEEDPFELSAEEGDLLDGSAFAQAIMPLVTVEDEANLDVSGIEVRITGRRAEAGAALYERRDYQGENRVVVDWGNIGLSENSEGPLYLLEADDVYTIEARATDLAGNVSEERSVTFSVNRYGSNFFVEPLYAQASGGEGKNTLLVEPPKIVVHEINVSGALSELEDERVGDAHSITKEYANATSAILRAGDDDKTGYALVASSDTSLTNPYEGWTEYVYTIHGGNFGEGSSFDYGDGGQGLYRVDVSTTDRANNHNTTARFWESGASRAEEAKDKTATVQFMLDEFGPKVEALDLPGALEIGESYEASFRLRDEITNGDYLSVLVDGEPVPVYADGSLTPLAGDGRVTRQGSYHFTIPAKALLAPRSVEIRASDYTRLESRTERLVRRDFRLTTLATEAAVIAALAFVVALVIAVVYRIHLVA